MKKIIAITAATLSTIVLNAQGDDLQNSLFRPEVMQIIASLFAMALFMIFILTILKRILEYRLKNKIVDKGIPENIVSSILQTNNLESRHINVKWFALLAGTGAGLTIVNYTLPLGIHSLAIMMFSISLSFLGYFFYLKQSGK